MSSPETVTTGRRKCARAVMVAMQAVSIRFPSWERKWRSARRDQTRWAVTMQSDSRSRAVLRRIDFSRRRERVWSRSVGRPTSKDGEAIGPISVDIVNVPSNGRSGRGFIISAEILARTLPRLP